MMKKLNDSLEKYQKEMSELNDGEKILVSLGNSIKIIVNDAVNNANSTDSVDDRINSLIGGLQSTLKEIGMKQQDFFKTRAVLEIKIQTLEDLLLSDVDYMSDLDGPDLEE